MDSMKTKFISSLLTAVSLLFLCSCATTSDPHEGGLIGYLATGDEGYEKRIDKKEQHLADTEAQADREGRKSTVYEEHRNDMRAQLAAQREELAQLEAQTQQMLADTRALKEVAEDKEQKKEELLAKLGSVQGQIQEVQGDSTLLIAEKQQRIDELKAEVNQLLELYSLLTTF